MQWLNENDDMSMEYLHNALEKDRQTGVNFNKLILFKKKFYFF